MRRCFAVLPIVVLLIGFGAPSLRAAAPRTLVPIGSGYESDTLERFALAAAEHDTSGVVELLVLPITYATDPEVIDDQERAENLELADGRRGEVEVACNAVREASQTCSAVLAPILVRADALDSDNLALFVPDLDGIYILGGDQTIAMQVVAGTPVEQYMEQAYLAGAVVGGNSAGAAVESANMIAGYVGDNGPEQGLQQGSVDIWTIEGQSDPERGLYFGLKNALLDQHALQRGREARLISAAWRTGLLGIGADAETAATIVDETVLTDVAGRSAAYVVDLDTYGADGRYDGPTDSLAIGTVATHVLPSGGYGYNLATQQPLLNGRPLAAPSIDGRSFDQLRIGAKYGPLLLGGGLAGYEEGEAAARFVRNAGGNAARIVVLTLGYTDNGAAQADANAWKRALRSLGAAEVKTFSLDRKAPLSRYSGDILTASGVLLTSPDASRVLQAAQTARSALDLVSSRWRKGLPVLADDAAAVALGSRMAADPPLSDDYEEESIVDFRPDGVDLRNGLGWLPRTAVESGIVYNRQWGQFYNVVASRSELLGLGVDVGTAVELTSAGATVVGDSAALVLDGRRAGWGVGDNGALAASWVLLDTFVDGDTIQP